MNSISKVAHSRTARRFALLAEVLRVEFCRVGVEGFVVVDAGDVDVEHFSLLHRDFRARYPAIYQYVITYILTGWLTWRIVGFS